MKKILVPTDFSKIADNALNEAIQIAKKSNSEIVLLSVVEEGSTGSVKVTGEVMQEEGHDKIFVIKLIEKTKERLANVINEHSDVTIYPEIRIGNPFHSITDIVSEHKIGLIVMGTKGATGLEELVIGSNTEKVVRHAKCPVLSVHDKSTSNYKEIVFASSFDDSEAGLIDVIKTFQATYDSTIHMVWVNTPNNFERDKLTKIRMRQFIEKHKIQNCTVNIYSDITEEDGIISFAEDKNADMIAMITHGRTGFAHLIAGSIAEDVVNHTKRPVLTYSITK